LIGHHAVPDDVFAALAVGTGGQPAMRLLSRAQRNKHLLLLRLVVVTATRMDHPQARELARAYDLLTAAQLDRPLDVDPLLCHPPVGAWAIRAWCDLRRGNVLDWGYLAALAAAAALLAGMECSIEVPLTNGGVFLPLLGRIHPTFEETVKIAVVRSWPHGGKILAGDVRVPIPSDPRHDSDSWSGLRRLTVNSEGTSTAFVLDDLDPYRLPGARTTGHLNAVDVAMWYRTLSDAWALLVANHPEIAQEIAAGVTVLVPLHSPAGHQVSATSRHSFGAVALSLPADGRNLAVTLAHERQHLKLCALLDLVALIDDPGQRCWYAPWRKDPRPLGALLQGAYAHVGVAAFWRRQRHVDRDAAALQAHAEFVRWRDETRHVITTLRTSGALTAEGTCFVDGMAASLDTWAAEPAPMAAVRLARTAAAEHRMTWRQRHGDLAENL
jgi:HEXXH motif-containing protein